MPKIAIATEIQYRLTNNGQEPIYCLLMGIDPSGNGFTLIRSHLEPIPDHLIAPGESLVLPNQSLPTWRVAGPVDLTEIYQICSRHRFEKTFKVLETSQVFNHERNPIFTLVQPLEVAQAILENLAFRSAVRELFNNSLDHYALDVNIWATLTFIYQVVE